MQKTAHFRAYLYLIRRTGKPFQYPTARALQNGLRGLGLSSSLKSLERLRQQLTEEFGYRVDYDKHAQGYYLNAPDDEDVGEFEQFVQLLERWERLTFFTRPDGAAFDLSAVGRFLHFEQGPAQRGTEHLRVLWQALTEGRAVHFTYQPFDGDDPKARHVAPCLLLEDRNRWYLVGWEVDADPQKARRVKTFGVDRMADVALTSDAVAAHEVHAQADYFRDLKNQALGVHCGPEQVVTRVVLCFSTRMAPYIRTLPLHESQRVVAETDGTLTVALDVVHNVELEREILGYGEHVTVLAPDSLRADVAQRVRQMHAAYANHTDSVR